MRSALLGVLLLLVVISCGGSDSSATVEPDVVRVAVLPDQSEERLRARYEPLLAHLDQVAGIDVELVIPTSYDSMLATFADGEVDLAWFGGLTFLHAERDAGARPLVVRDVDLEFTTDFIASTAVAGEALDDFIGDVFAFGPELSTSGHLMPRFHLATMGLTPETAFGQVLHTGGHDETAILVRDGKVAVGAVNSVVLESMLRDGSISADQIRIVQRTRPYRNYVWATSSELGDDVRARLLEGFLSLDRTDSEDRTILAELGAGGFLPATTSDFSGLREAARAVGLLDGGG